MTLDHTLEPSSPYGWDWTQTTHDVVGTDLTVGQAVEQMTVALGGSHVLPNGRGYQGWSNSVNSFDCEGYLLGTVFFGGDRTDVHVQATGAAADLVREDLVRQGGHLADPKTARVDTRVDTLVPLDDLVGIAESAVQGYGTQITEVASRVDGVSTGRTLYLGSPKSAVRVRIYEKWLESPGQYVEGTNRVEVQLRPASRVKDRVSGWSRAETFCASRVTRELAYSLGDDLAPKASLHVDRGTPDLERSIRAAGTQYGKAFNRWLEVSGGDMGALLDALTVRVPH